jgi:hypothetical protein
LDIALMLCSKVIVGVVDDMWADGTCDCRVAWVSLLGNERRTYKVAMPFLEHALAFDCGDQVN